MPSRAPAGLRRCRHTGCTAEVDVRLVSCGVGTSVDIQALYRYSVICLYSPESGSIPRYYLMSGQLTNFLQPATLICSPSRIDFDRTDQDERLRTIQCTQQIQLPHYAAALAGRFAGDALWDRNV